MRLNNKIQQLHTGVHAILLMLFLLFPVISFTGDEALEGNIVFSDSYSSDFDGDLTLNYKIQTYAEGSGSSKKYTGFLGTFTGVADGGCQILKLLFNQRMCNNATVKIKTPTPGMDGELDFFNGGEYTVDSSSRITLLSSKIQKPCSITTLVKMLKRWLLYNTPELTSTGECKQMSACELCAPTTLQ